MKRALDGWLDHPAVDWAGGTVAGACGYLVAGPAGADSTHRVVALQTSTEVAVGLLSVGIVAVTLIFTVTPNDRLAKVFTQVGQGLRRIVESSLWGLVLATGGFVALLIASPRGKTLAGIGAFIGALAILRFLRLLWIFGRILEALVQRAESTSNNAPWSRPEVGKSDYQIPRRQIN